ETFATAAVGHRLPRGGIRYQITSGSPTAAYRPTSRLLVGVSRTESGLYRNRSGGFVRWHLGCVFLNPFANPLSAEPRAFFPAVAETVARRGTLSPHQQPERWPEHTPGMDTGPAAGRGLRPLPQPCRGTGRIGLRDESRSE